MGGEPALDIASAEQDTPHKSIGGQGAPRHEAVDGDRGNAEETRNVLDTQEHGVLCIQGGGLVHRL